MGDKFIRIYIKPYVVNLLLKCLVEAVLLMVHKICFQWDIRKSISVWNLRYTSLSSADTLVVFSGIIVI